jgi:hypothetical protein
LMKILSRSRLGTKMSIPCVEPAIWFSDFKNWKRTANKKPPLRVVALSLSQISSPVGNFFLLYLSKHPDFS